MAKAKVAKRRTKNRFAIPPAWMNDADPKTAGHVDRALTQTEAALALAMLVLASKVVEHGRRT